MKTPVLIQNLMDALEILPGVGQRSAERMATHLLERDQAGAYRLVHALEQALAKVHGCARCRALTDKEICHLCADESRNKTQLCVVETAKDQQAMELSGGYDGEYFILRGHLSPIDGIGAQQLGIPLLLQRAQDDTLKEIILALNNGVESEATSHYIVQQLKPFSVKVSRLAQGISHQINRMDGLTLVHSINDRKTLGLDDD